MAERVKPKRPYDSPRRREQAAATRLEILEAAQRLFERDGYPATTMAAIATEARVALKTVYVAFETKSGVLRALWNLRLRAGAEDVPIAAHAIYRQVLDEPDPERQLRLNARNSREGKLRVAAIAEVIRSAAPLDPDIAHALEPDQHRIPRQPARDHRNPRRQERAHTPSSTSNARPTSSGRSTTPTPGSCSSPNAAGPPSNTNNGPPTPPSPNS